ncbi:MAG: amidohydrolase [Rubrivivax sp.]|jgi:predicted amidohydrolase YtcJ|nr:amidohydrolase [Betaproteobacteria bacterium]MBP6464274.1 amidohydrolase [Rubrivivax sp.]
MKHDTYECFCCSGAFGSLFAANCESAGLAAQQAPPLRRRTLLTGAVAAAGAWPAMARAQGAAATVFTGGTVLTVDRRFSQAEAIAIRGNRIVAVGSDAAVRAAAGAQAQVVDLRGRVMLPGFVEPHAHVVAGALVDSLMDHVGMTRFATTALVLEHLKTKARTTPPGQWIMGRNFDPSLQAGPASIGFAELDAVSKEHPVFVLNASGHLAYANRRAFAAAGIPDDVANPQGAEFVRDASGRLSGVMKNNLAFGKLLFANPAVKNADPVKALIGLLGKWGRVGLTTASELALGSLSQSPADWQVMMAAAQSGQLKARIRAYPFYTLGADAWDQAGVKPDDGNALARIVGYKLVADGSNQGFTGLQREPYLNSDDRGLAYMSIEDLKAQAVDRARKGWQLAIHGNGDAAIDNVLTALQAVSDAGVDMSRLRARIEHCSMLHDEQIAKMKSLKVSASFLVGHVHFWGVALRDKVFGSQRVQRLVRARSVEQAGIGYSLHSDFMVTDPNPLHMIQMAVTRRTWQEPQFVLAPGERVSVESAIRAVTAEAAWQLRSEHEIGSLEAGKLADFVILDQDPRRVDPERIKDIAVIETWMDGQQVFSA